MLFCKTINKTVIYNRYLIILFIILLFCTSCSEVGKSKIFESKSPKNIGIDFLHNNAHKTLYKFPEIMGSGLAAFDYDLDGDLDLYFVQNNIESSDQLYKNLYNETGKLKFKNITSEVGINQITYGLGVSIGDYNNDGYPDIYLSNVNSNIILKNNNGNSFTDVTKIVGLNSYNEMSVSSAFADLNEDGWLDLIVLNNIDFDSNNEPKCKMFLGDDYCAPSSYGYLANRIFINNNGKFNELDKNISGLNKSLPSLALATFDANSDGLIDIYIANDDEENTLWINQGDLSFKNAAIEMGLAVNGLAKVEASMGIALGDINSNSQLDLYLTHMWKESNTLYLNENYNYYTDATNIFQLTNPSINSTGFGTSFLDFDNDGDLDIAIANGSILRKEVNNYESGYNEHNHFYLHEKNKFTLLDNNQVVSNPSFNNSRGLVRVDLDNDGDQDILISNINNIPEIYVNNSNYNSNNNWIGVKLLNDKGLISENTEAIVSYDNKRFRYIQTRNGSYGSSSDPRIQLGLGSFSGNIEINVRWGKSEFEKFSNLEVNQYNILTQGSGVAVSIWEKSNVKENISQDKLINYNDINEEIRKSSQPIIVKNHLLSKNINNKENLCISLQSYEMSTLASECYRLLFDDQVKNELTVSSETYYLASMNEINVYDNNLALNYLEIAKDGIDEWYYCYRKAQIHFLQEKFDVAININKECSQYKETIHNIKLAGDIFKAQENYKMAFDMYKKVLLMEPDKNHVYNDLADILKHNASPKMQALAKSRSGTKKLKLLDPMLNKLSDYNKNPDYHLDKALLLNQKKDFRSALFAIKRAFELSPNDEEIYANYALLLKENNNYQIAINLLSSKIKSFKNPDSFIILGSLFNKINNIKKSQEIYITGLKVFPNNLNLLTNLANNYFRLNKLSLAEKYYREILAIDNENINAKRVLKKISEISSQSLNNRN